MINYSHDFNGGIKMDGICSCNQNIPDKWNLSAYGKSVNAIAAIPD